MSVVTQFASHRLSQITVAEVDRYRAWKVRERELPNVERPLSNNSINKTIKRLAQVLDVAVEYGHLAANPASGRRRRLKADPPRRARLEAEQVAQLLEVAGEHRALLATAIMAGGLRVSQVRFGGRRRGNHRPKSRHGASPPTLRLGALSEAGSDGRRASEPSARADRLGLDQENRASVSAGVGRSRTSAAHAAQSPGSQCAMNPQALNRNGALP